jgi:hypothetical protein
MSHPNSKKELTHGSVRLVVEVDGNPVGFLNLDLDRLWPLINHRQRDSEPVEWMDPSQFDAIMRAAVMKKLTTRIQGRLYQSLGDEMVKAELEAENFNLKADAAAQTFGRSKADIEKLVASWVERRADFDAFFWEYLLDDREVNDLKREWKSKDIPPR